MAIFKYLHKAIPLKMTYIWILYVYSHTLFASILTLDNYLIIRKKLVTQKQKLGKNAALCLELRAISHSHTHTHTHSRRFAFNSNGGLKQFI